MKSLLSRLTALESGRESRMLLLAAVPQADSDETDFLVRYGRKTWCQAPGESWDNFCLRAGNDISALTGRPVLVVSPIDAAI